MRNPLILTALVLAWGTYIMGVVVPSARRLKLNPTLLFVGHACAFLTGVWACVVFGPFA